MVVGEETRPRGEIAAQYGSPGPVYSLPGLVGERNHDPRFNKQPGYSFGTRHGKWKDEASPGPIYLPDLKYSRYGPDGSPRYSIYGRPHDLKSYQASIPGPGRYKNEECTDSVSPRAPAYSFGARTNPRNTDNSPGPAAYSVPPLISRSVEGNRRQAPSYTLVGRRTQGSFHEDLSKCPGPGAYSVPAPELYKVRAPQYTLIGRTQPVSDNTLKPGPGAHSPENSMRPKYGKRGIGPRLKAKQSQYLVPLFTRQDVFLF